MSAHGIYGLSGSGIDVDSMVKAGMLTRQNKYDKMYQQSVQDTWTKEAYADIYQQLNTFNQSTLHNYRLTSATLAQSAISGNSAIATAIANANAAPMMHTIDVQAVATNAYFLSANPVARANAAAPDSIKIKDIINQPERKADPNDSSITQLPEKTVTGMSEQAYKDYLADASHTNAEKDALRNKVALSFTVSNGGSNADDSATVTFTYQELYDNEQTLNDLASKISRAGINANASYDTTNNAFTVFNKDGGASNKLNITVTNLSQDTTDSSGTVTDAKADDAARALLNSLNLADVERRPDGTTAQGSVVQFADGQTQTATASGQDGTAVIDGKSYTTTGTKITASGVTYTTIARGSTTVTVSQDNDKIVENVKKFVDDYNKLLDSLDDKYYAQPNDDYKPLTQAQESAMTQDQITKWNDKAKTGLLYHNQQLGDIITNIRNAMITPVNFDEAGTQNSRYNNMMAIGITTTTDRGHIQLDEDKLIKALSEEPGCVQNIFNSLGDVKVRQADGSEETTTDYSREGVLGRISDSIYNGLKKINQYSGTTGLAGDGSTLGDMITDLLTKMSDFKTQMNAYENVLYNQYDQMETAIQRLGMQMNYITGGR